MRIVLGQSIASLSPEEKLIHYRLFAEDALEKARKASSPELRAGFLTMANGWHEMATELERMMRGAGHLAAVSRTDRAADQDDSAH